MIRPLLSLEWLSFEKKEVKASYQYRKESPKQEKMDYMEFIERVFLYIK